jgi:hypothetical protein
MSSSSGGKSAKFPAKQLKQWANVAIARAGGAVQMMGKMSQAELNAAIARQITVQTGLNDPPMIVLPAGMTWKDVIPGHLLTPKSNVPLGQPEWRKWGEIKRWMKHAQRWWADALDKFGYTEDTVRSGSGKNMDDVWRFWKQKAWEHDKKPANSDGAGSATAEGGDAGADASVEFDENYEPKFYEVFRETYGVSDNKMECWVEARRLEDEGGSDPEDQDAGASGSRTGSGSGAGKRRKSAALLGNREGGRGDKVSRKTQREEERRSRDGANADHIRESSHETMAEMKETLNKMAKGSAMADLRSRMKMMTQLVRSFPTLALRDI